MAPAALAAYGACRLWRLPRVALAACDAGCLRHTVPLLAPFSFKLASTGLQRPKSAQITVFGMSKSDVIIIYHFWAGWTLPTCSNVPYTTLFPTIVCLVWPLEASRGPNQPKSAQITVSGLSLERHIIVIDHLRTHRTPLVDTLDASNLLQYATNKFSSYYCLFGLTSRGLQRPI